MYSYSSDKSGSISPKNNSSNAGMMICSISYLLEASALILAFG